MVLNNIPAGSTRHKDARTRSHWMRIPLALRKPFIDTSREDLKCHADTSSATQRLETPREELMLHQNL